MQLPGSNRNRTSDLTVFFCFREEDICCIVKKKNQSLVKRLEFLAYGNRRNTFGQLHNCSNHVMWCGTDAWRTEGETWAYEYQLTETGLLTAPFVGLDYIIF